MTLPFGLQAFQSYFATIEYVILIYLSLKQVVCCFPTIYRFFHVPFLILPSYFCISVLAIPFPILVFCCLDFYYFVSSLVYELPDHIALLVQHDCILSFLLFLPF